MYADSDQFNIIRPLTAVYVTPSEIQMVKETMNECNERIVNEKRVNDERTVNGNCACNEVSISIYLVPTLLLIYLLFLLVR